MIIVVVIVVVGVEDECFLCRKAVHFDNDALHLSSAGHRSSECHQDLSRWTQGPKKQTSVGLCINIVFYLFIVLYLSISIALLAACAFQKRFPRPQQLTLSDCTRRSATGNCK